MIFTLLKNRTAFLTLIATISFLSLFSQQRKTKYADRLFETLKYKEASIEYEKLYEKGVETKSLLEHLGDSYYYNTDMRNASKWYNRLLTVYQDQDQDSIYSEYYFRYAHALQGIGENKEAKKWMKKFAKNTVNEDLRKANYVSAKNELERILNTNANYEIQNVSTNTKYSDFGVSYYGEEVVFASAFSKDKTPINYYWNNQPYLNLFVGYSNQNFSDIEDATLFSSDINTPYHESNAVFTKDLKKVYFTRNNYKKKLKSDEKGINHLKLYSAEIIEEGNYKLKKNWTNIKELPFNSNAYSVGHPALSNDEKLLYFTSDMPGTIGGTDIFVVDVYADNEYSKPRNLGEKINTSGREMFPFITDNALYFASDGHLGFGGLDVFKSNLINGNFQLPTNMGKPINSPKDDFALVFKNAEKTGFLSSNRKGGKGDDDIYAVIPIAKKKACNQRIKGIVSNLITQERITNAQLELYDELGNKVATTTTNKLGQYKFDSILDCNSRYEVKVEKQGHKSVVKPILTEAINGESYLPLAVETLDKLIVEEKGILKLKIGIIYFNLDKDFIRNDAAIELNKIVLIMTQYPKMHIKIESHTDSRMPASYNKDLSDRRAKSTREYLISQGIESSRIESAMGYGEEQLINNCADGVSCSEQQHQLNRRSEFIITKI